MEKQKIELPVIGMTCANCAATIERTLSKKVPGVISANVNFGTESCSVVYDSNTTNLETISDAVDKVGYKLIIPRNHGGVKDDEQVAREQEIRREKRSLLVGIIFTLPLFTLSMSRDFSFLGAWSHSLWVNWLFMVVAPWSDIVADPTAAGQGTAG